jgi:hypothetical protein
MKNFLRVALFFPVIVTFGARFAFGNISSDSDDSTDDSTSSNPKILKITATIDGSDRFIFAGTSVRLEHKFWDPPTNVVFDGKPWTDFSQPPAGWRHIATHLDLTKAHIVDRHGRDVIALEITRDGFDLYFDDSPNGADDYDVTISIPERDDASGSGDGQ